MDEMGLDEVGVELISKSNKQNKTKQKHKTKENPKNIYIFLVKKHKSYNFGLICSFLVSHINNI